MKNTPHIVLIEDDWALSEMMASFLEHEGFRISRAHDGEEGVALVAKEKPDLVVLDIMMPLMDGVEVCRRIRPDLQGFIVMLTARDDDLTRVAALNTGADSYLVKPIRPHVLLAHIQALFRRSNQTRSEKGIIHVQDLEIDKGAFRLTRGEKEIPLTSGEFQLLLLLAESKGVPLNRDILYQELRGIEYDGIDRAIDLRISSLRKKLNDNIPPYRYIKTVRNKGYLLVTT